MESGDPISSAAAFNQSNDKQRQGLVEADYGNEVSTLSAVQRSGERGFHIVGDGVRSGERAYKQSAVVFRAKEWAVGFESCRRRYSAQRDGERAFNTIVGGVHSWQRVGGRGFNTIGGGPRGNFVDGDARGNGAESRVST